MANGLLEEKVLKDIANAIRSKNGKTNLMYPNQMALEISLLKTGGSGGSMAVNIKEEYGAKGDGITNDTDALKKAAASGKSIYFPEGTYLLYEQIDMTDDIRWWGDGECSIIKFMPYDQSRPEAYGGKTVYNAYMMTQSEADCGYSVYLRDLVLDGNKEGYDADILNNGSSRYDHVTCMDMYKPKNVYMHNVIIRNALIEGCYIFEPSGVAIISDCQFVNNGYSREDASGLHIEGNHRNTVVSNCVFNENGFHGLLMGGTMYANVSNISCSDNGYDGLVLWGGASHNTISNVFCSGNRGGVYLKSQYSPFEEDYIDSDWLIYASGNIINGLTTKGNEYGIMFGFSKDTNINGWSCVEDEVAVAICIDVDASTASYITNDITGTICNAVLNPVNGKAQKFFDDVSKFKVKLISGTDELIVDGDWYTPEAIYTIGMEAGRIDSATGGEYAEDGVMRSDDFFVLPYNELVHVSNSVDSIIRIFLYDTNKTMITGWNEGYSYWWMSPGLTLDVPTNAVYMRFYVETSDSTVHVYFKSDDYIDLEYGDINSSNGQDNTTETSCKRSKDYIPITAGQKIQARSSASIAYLYLYDESQTFMTGWNTQESSGSTSKNLFNCRQLENDVEFTIPEGAAYCRFDLMETGELNECVLAVKGLSSTAPDPGTDTGLTDITMMFGETPTTKNLTFLSKLNTAGATVQIVGGSTVNATCEGYISKKPDYAVYKSTIAASNDDFQYIITTAEGKTSGPIDATNALSDISDTYQFIAVGDPQITNDEAVAGWKDSMNKAFNQYPNAKFIACLGDIVDSQADLQLAEQQFTGFCSASQVKKYPMLIAMGNHDDNMEFDGHFFAPNESTYGVAGGQGDYWVKYDNTLFIVLNSNASGSRAAEHVNFIAETVTNYIETYGKPTWTIVMLHYSMFSATDGYTDNVLTNLRNDLTPYLSLYNVDLVLMGHEHSYTRTHVLDCSSFDSGDTITAAVIVPNSNGASFTKSPKQVSYVTLNSSSGSKYYALYTDPWYSAKTVQEYVPNFSCIDVTTERIIITTHRTSDMTVIDQFTLSRDPDSEYEPPLLPDIRWESGRFTNSGGGVEEDDSSSIRTVDYISIEGGQDYTITHTSTVPSGHTSIWYYSDNNGTYISREYFDSGETITTPSNAAYCRLMIEDETSMFIEVTITLVQPVVLPILDEIVWELGDISSGSGGTNEDSDTAIRTTGYLRCEPSTSYAITESTSGDIAIYWYSDSDGTFISREYLSDTDTVTSPADAVYLRITISPETNLSTVLTFDPPLPTA